MPAPRICCIPAIEAPVVAVFRRGPTNWSHVGRWDLAKMTYEPGAWFGGRIFPRRSDLSPDGRLLCYFAHKPGAAWEHGDAYVAISKLPWLAALHAFATCGTWTRGYCFTGNGEREADGVVERFGPYALRPIPVVQFATERRRGWENAPDSPTRPAGDAWDANRNARMRKTQPGGRRVLSLESLGRAGGEFGAGQAVDGVRVLYSLETEDGIDLLHDLQWADWDRDGRLLAATRSGKIQIRDLSSDPARVVFEEDLSRFEPDPTPPPAWAREW